MKSGKDSIAMICNIGELAGMFERSTSVEGFLQSAVSVVAYHMHAAVCSVYLLDDAGQELVLAANQGLSPEAIGRVRLKVGEGLCGLALKELRPIREGDAPRNPGFKFIPGIQEERYRAFLAVPILRGVSRVGVLAIQDPVPDYFDDNDARALQAIAAQLASVIEHARLLISLGRAGKDSAAPHAAPPTTDLRFVRGIPAASGWAIGQAFLPTQALAAEEPILPASAAPLEQFRKAVHATEQQLDELQRTLEKRLSDVATLIFSAHLLMLKDRSFTGEMEHRIAGGLAPERAVRQVTDMYVERFERSSNPRLREKVHDIRDLSLRLLQNLRGTPARDIDHSGHILVTEDLLPSAMLQAAARQVAGVLLVGGGASAHIAILARSLQIPTVVAADRRFLDLGPGDRLLIDGDQGTVYVHPADHVVAKYEDLQAARQAAEQYVAPPRALTRDGQAVQVLTNINLMSELQLARRMNAAGVGLYRSEFPFLVRNDFPSEEELHRIYRQLLDLMPDRPVVLRTLDVGGDKVLSYYSQAAQANPFLGLRAIRFSLRNKTVFAQQLRAMLRAGVGHNLRIMFPLVSSVDDFVEARDFVAECGEQLRRDGMPFNDKPSLGVMVELPSAVEVADELAAEAQFLSVGSNDLVQYMLAVDRTNEHIADLYRPHHPAVLRALKRIVDAGHKHGRTVSICGDTAADPRLLPFLVGVGFDAVSVEVRKVPVVHQLLASIDAAAATRCAAHALTLGRIRDVEQALAANAAVPG